MSTMTNSTGTAGTVSRPGTTRKQKVGLVLCILFSISNIPSFLTAPTGGETGPPLAILVIDTILGVVGLVAGVMAWRGARVPLRVAAGSTIVSTLTALPAFFVDVPMGIKALVGVSVVLTVVIVALMFSGERQPAPLTD